MTEPVPPDASVGNHLHLVSEATGDTLNAIARATTAQFEHTLIVHHRWSLVRTRFQLSQVIDAIKLEPGPVLSTLIDQALRHELDTACQRMGLRLVHVLDPVLEVLQDTIGEQATRRPGRQYALTGDYFDRIDAMHYVLQHDDGHAQRGLAEADVVLVGVSRSSKTPTCFYLANRGVKAANVPLVPGTPEPAELYTLDKPIIGLTLDAEALIDIWRYRLKTMHAGARAGLASRDATQYVDEDAVRAELAWAQKLCRSRGWPVLNVTKRSIEETAASVMQLVDAWRRRHAEAKAGTKQGA